MSTQPRKGSMAEWEKKNNWKWKLVLSLGTLGFFLAFHVLNTDAHDFTRIAPGGAKFLGVLLMAASVVTLWIDDVLASISEKSGMFHGVLWVVLLALGCFVSTGFNFDYFTIGR